MKICRLLHQTVKFNEIVKFDFHNASSKPALMFRPGDCYELQAVSRSAIDQVRIN